MTSSTSESTASHWRIWAAAAGGLLLIVLMFFAFGRRDSERASTTDGDADTALRAEAELKRQLADTLDGLRPERLGVSSDLEGQVNDLNLWWADYAPAVGGTPAPELDEVGRMLGDGAAKHAGAIRFAARDAAHIRNCLLFRGIAQAVVQAADDDLERSVAAFEFVMRHVSLLNRTSEAPPLTAFEVLLLGRGNPAERAWAFIEILRQIEIDAVLLRPADAPSDSPGLVGVIIPNEGVYLFDTVLGLPIPSPAGEETVLPQRPATLSEARADDALFRQFDIPEGTAYPWTADMMVNAKVSFVTHADWCAPRMQTVETALPAEFAATLYDGVVEIEGGRDPIDRRIKAAGAGGLWDADDVDAWSYPEQQTASFTTAGGEQAEALAQNFRIIRGPRVLRKQLIDGAEQLVDSDSPQPLRAVRVLHMRGELQAALTAYGTIRSAPLELGPMNVYAREEAVYWIAVCQYELGRYDAAVSTLVLSLRDYPAGSWTNPALALLALCEVQRGKPDAAVEVLRTSSGSSPTIREAYLTQRWESLESPAPDETARE